MNAMTYSSKTSGDLLADRRFAYGDAALADGDFVIARDLFEQVLELTPDWPPAHFMLAKTCLELGDETAARAALERVRSLDPEDKMGAALLLAQLDGKPEGAMPHAYVAALFDEYAPRFDHHLAALGYRAPELLTVLIGEARAGRFRHVLDLGCGTGLMARALAMRMDSATGVDLSARMIEGARETGHYTRLVCGEIRAFLEREPEASADLAVAADVFCYVPDLTTVFAEVLRVLEPGGLFAFTIQTHEGGGVVLGADSRVHHAPAYIRACAAGAGFAVRHESAASTRRDRGADVPGALFLLAKP